MHMVEGNGNELSVIAVQAGVSFSVLILCNIPWAWISYFKSVFFFFSRSTEFPCVPEDKPVGTGSHPSNFSWRFRTGLFILGCDCGVGYVVRRLKGFTGMCNGIEKHFNIETALNLAHWKLKALTGYVLSVMNAWLPPNNILLGLILWLVRICHSLSWQLLSLYTQLENAQV